MVRNEALGHVRVMRANTGTHVCARKRTTVVPGTLDVDPFTVSCGPRRDGGPACGTRASFFRPHNCMRFGSTAVTVQAFSNNAYVSDEYVRAVCAQECARHRRPPLMKGHVDVNEGKFAPLAGRRSLNCQVRD